MKEDEITLIDVKNITTLLKAQETPIKICADCYILERVWVKDHSKCSGNWFEVGRNTGKIISMGLGKQQAQAVQDLFKQSETDKKNKGKIISFDGIKVVSSEFIEGDKK